MRANLGSQAESSEYGKKKYGGIVIKLEKITLISLKGKVCVVSDGDN